MNERSFGNLAIHHRLFPGRRELPLIFSTTSGTQIFLLVPSVRPPKKKLPESSRKILSEARHHNPETNTLRILSALGLQPVIRERFEKSVVLVRVRHCQWLKKDHSNFRISIKSVLPWYETPHFAEGTTGETHVTSTFEGSNVVSIV